jgi:hypothetical protein
VLDAGGAVGVLGVLGVEPPLGVDGLGAGGAFIAGTDDDCERPSTFGEEEGGVNLVTPVPESPEPPPLSEPELAIAYVAPNATATATTSRAIRFGVNADAGAAG